MNDRDGVILQLYSRARAPNRDYYGLTVTQHEVVLNIWNITHGPHVFPKKQKCPLGDLQIAKQLLSEIHRLFGLHVVEYALSLSRGDARLECLPSRVFLKILRSLATNDVLNLGQTSKIFFELCNRNDSWGIVFIKRNKGKPSRDEIKAAETKGWKIILKNKLVWADRLQRIGKNKTATKQIKSERVSSAHVNKKVVVVAQTQKQKTLFTTPNIGVNLNASMSLPSFPMKGILKKPVDDNNKALKLRMDYSKTLETIEEKKEPSMTKFNYLPMAKPTGNLGPNSLSMTSESDSHLGRFLHEIETKEQDYPQKLNAKNKVTPTLSSVIRKCTTDKYSPSKYKPKPKFTFKANQANQSKVQAVNDTNDANASDDNLSSKFEKYLTTMKIGEKSNNSMKNDLIPRISDLGKSLTSMRSNFYSTNKLKIAMNNTKVTNKNVQPQQLNNKLNVVPGVANISSPELKLKRNVLRNPVAESSASGFKTNKVKNTNCNGNNTKSKSAALKKTMNLKNK